MSQGPCHYNLGGRWPNLIGSHGWRQWFPSVWDDIATKIGYGTAVLDNLPVYEDIPTARVQTTEPPKTR